MHITFLLLQHDHLPSYTERSRKTTTNSDSGRYCMMAESQFHVCCLVGGVKEKKYFLLPFFAFLYILVDSHDILRFSCISLRDQKHIYEKRFPELQSVWKWPLKSLIHFKIVCQTFLVAISVGKIQYLDKSSTIPFAACALQRKRDTLGYSENSRLLPQKLLLSSDEF